MTQPTNIDRLRELDESGRDAPGVVYRLLSAFVATPSDEEVEACARAHCISRGYDPDGVVERDYLRWRDYADMVEHIITASREHIAGLVLK